MAGASAVAASSAGSMSGVSSVSGSGISAALGGGGFPRVDLDVLTPEDVRLLFRLCMTREHLCDDDESLAQVIDAMLSVKARLAQ